MKKNLAYLPSVSDPVNGSQTSPYYYVYGYEGTNVTEAKATTNYQTYGVFYNWPASLAIQTRCSAPAHQYQNPYRVLSQHNYLDSLTALL